MLAGDIRHWANTAVLELITGPISINIKSVSMSPYKKMAKLANIGKFDQYKTLYIGNLK